MKRSWLARHPIGFMALYTIFYLSVFHSLEANVPLRSILVHCRLDDLIPFCKYAVIPYFAWFVWIPFTLFYLLWKAPREDFWRLCLPLFSGMTIALACYAVLPTALDLRPYWVPGSDIFAQTVRFLYRTDTATNVCPSIHVFNSVTLLLAYYRSRIFDAPRRRWMRPAAAVLCISIVCSTVLLKQHSCIDVALGALLALVLAASAALPVFAADTAPTDTIYINSVSDLLAFADKCGFDQWSKGKTVILQEDLSLEDTEWAPVASFSGAFKGNGHTISDVSLVGAYSPAGFFGILEEGGSIQDLTIKGVVNPAGTQKTAGGLVGTNYGTIINCTFSGAVHGEEEAGGLVGRNETSGTIDHSTSRAMVSGAYATGGIVGYNLGVITGCTNVGAVNSEYQESALDMEGLPATLLELVKKDMGDDLSNNISNVSSDTGGIAGRSSGLILSSANAGDVGYAHVGYNVGGIVGRTDGLISGCVNQGLVQGRKDVGGIAGQAEPYVELDLDQSTINRLRTELDTLHTMVNGAADDMDGSTSLLNTDLNTLNSQMDLSLIHISEPTRP